MSKCIKTISSYFYLICLVATLSVGAQTPASGPVKLFQGPNATGAAQDIPPGTYRVDGRQLAGTLGKDAVISVQVSRSFRVRFCDDQGTTGEAGRKCEEFGAGKHDLKQKHTASYVKVWAVDK